MSRLPSNRPRAVVNGPATPYANARISAERVEMALRTRFDPLPTLNPQRLVQSLQQFERGYLDPAARTWEAMERRDDRLASVSAKAKSALARYGFEVRMRPNLPLALREEAAKHQAALEHLYTHCTVTNAVREDESGGFSLLVRQMADAIGKRYSVHEILWEPGADSTLTATFRHAPLWFFEATSGKLRYKLQEGAATGVDLDPDAWLVTVGDGIMEACSVLWVYKHLPLRDWLAYSEKFGMPYLLGKTQAIFNSQEWLAMVAALRGFGSDGAAVVGGADDIVPVAVGSGSEATPFPGLVERSERAMSILWRGADLGTQAHSGSGQGQGASLQGDETAALDEDRAAWLSESLASVSRTAIKYLFGAGVQPLAYVRLKTQVAQDIQLDLAVDTFLLSNGAPLGLADVLARYNRPTPGADEPLLKPPGNVGGSGGAKAAASEDATLASIERAANAVLARLAAGNFNPYHDKLGRFTTGDGAVAPGSDAAGESSAFDKGGWGSASGTDPSAAGQPGVSALPPRRKPVFVRADDLRRALEAENPQALQALHDQYTAHTNHPAAGQRPVMLSADNPLLWVTPISADANSPWARAYPLTEEDLRLAGRETAKFGKGFLVNGPVHAVTGTVSALYQASPGVQLSRQVEDLRRAAANPKGMVAGYEEIAQERRQAVVDEVKRLTSTSEGQGELFFDLATLFAGGEELAGEAAEVSGAGRVSEVQQALGRAGETTGESGPGLFSRTGGKAMDRAEYARIKEAFERRDRSIRQTHFMVDDHYAVLELNRIEAIRGGKIEGATWNHNFILLRPGASRSAVFEELIHTAQMRRGMRPDPDWLPMEIEAKQKLIKFQKRYKISDTENAETVAELRRLLNRQTK